MSGQVASISSLKISPQPTLLDRLTVSPTEESVDSLHRDVASLLSTTALAASRDLSPWKRVSRSVLNYGVAGFTGRLLTSADVPEVQRNIARALELFEPRLAPKSIQVTVDTAASDQSLHGWRVHIVARRLDCTNAAQFEFKALIDAQSGQLHMTD